MAVVQRLRSSRGWAGIAVAAAFASLLACPAGRGAPASGDELQLAIILTRHGIRSPLQSNEALAAFSSQPWPKWEVPSGIQTPHGNALIAQMGEYYRAYLTDAGALAGDPAVDGQRVFVRADNDQRTIETGRILGKSLAGAGDTDVHAIPGSSDPLFRPVMSHIGSPNEALASAAVMGRIGGDPRRLELAYATQFAELKGILYGPGGAPPGASPLDAPTVVRTGGRGYLVEMMGPFRVALECTEALSLEYADGMPLSDVGWGRVDDRALSDLFALHGLYFDLTQRTFYLAQVGGSNLASHIVDTLEQATLGQPVPGALGPPGERVVVLVGHDTNIANIGGLFGMNWWIPGTQANPTLPGGALVFELWRRGAQQNAYYVRTRYVCQTLSQMRESAPLSLGSPPGRSPIFIPGCGGPGPDFDAPMAAFVRVARRVIDPAFVAEEP